MAHSLYEERRSFPRHDAVSPEAWLAWESAEGYQTARARVYNISVHGIALFVDAGLPESTLVWVTLAYGAQFQWIPASLMVNDTGNSPDGMIRLRFFGECPYNLFRAAVLGTADASRGIERTDLTIISSTYPPGNLHHRPENSPALSAPASFCEWHQ